jgi:hypothetical protein
VIVFENDADVELKVDLKVPRRDCGASEKSRKSHVDRYLDLWTAVAVGDLEILNFCSIFAVAFGTTASLNSNQLDLDGFNGDFRVVDRDEPVEWF